MKLNQILISLEEYDALRDFKANVENGNTLKRTVYCQGVDNVVTTYIFPDKEAKSLFELKGKIEKLEADNMGLRTSRSDCQNLIHIIRNMTIREFLKWRKS